MSNEEPNQKAPRSYINRIIRKRIRKHEEQHEEGLNIYPMMDMMTILLVFLVMQFASSSAAVIQETSELRIPYSTSKVDIQDAIPILISKTSILVDGKEVIALRNGQVDPSQKQGGGSGFLITPLFKNLKRIAKIKKIVARNDPTQPFEGKVQIVADKNTPYRTLSEIIYSAGQAEFSQLHFVVNKGK